MYSEEVPVPSVWAMLAANIWKQTYTVLICYSLSPKINTILWFKICPTKNAILTQQPQKTRVSGDFSYKRQANV